MSTPPPPRRLNSLTRRIQKLKPAPSSETQRPRAATAFTPSRSAYSPGEFAALFGKSKTWGYRQIYSGKVKAITDHGTIMIPAAEVDKICKSAGIYSG